MIPHLEPMPGQIVGVAVPEPERAAIEEAEAKEEKAEYQRTKFPSRAMIIIDIGVFTEDNSFSYIAGFPEGLTVGARAIVGNEYGIREAEGCFYFSPNMIIAWEPAVALTGSE